MLKTQVHSIFLEDMAMIQAQQQNMDLGPSAAVGLGQDKAWMAMRGILQRLAAEDNPTSAAGRTASRAA